jgi:soluble lytic murein transglycosylase-like protein
VIETDPPLDLNAIIRQLSLKHGLDPDLIRAVIRAESAFNQRAVSPKGARGLMQLMPATAAELGVADSFDPAANVEAGARYLRELLARHNNDLAKALAAYNAGPGAVERHRGIPPYRETIAYIRRIITDFNRAKLAQKKLRASAD